MWKNLPLKNVGYLSLVLGIVSIITIILAYNFLPPVVPLLYGLPSGQSQLVPKLILFIAPVVGILVTFLNLLIARFAKDIFFKKTLIIAGAFITILATIATIKTILLVGFF